MKGWWPFFAPHPADAELLAIAADAGCEARVAAHARACAACSERLRAFDRAWAELRESAAATADVEFTEARLERQRSQILKRLARHGRTARVLPFPAPRRFVEATHHVARRWVAAAAVMGLLVGMVAGRFIDRRPGSTTPARAIVARPAAEAGGTGSGGRRSNAGGEPYPSDEALLVELDAAAVMPRFEALQTLDALTPRLRENGESGR